jgi:alanine-synthesizing transaminase
MFSKRFEYNIEENKLSRLLKEKKAACINVFDLTESNPTNAGFSYNEIGIRNSIATSDSTKYNPDPKGLKSSREAVSQYYNEKNLNINADNIILTSGTSEAYSFIFKLLADPEDEILIPRPGYPLFSFIAEMESVRIKYYDLEYSDENSWGIDFNSLKSQVTDKTKAVVLVNPNNPTGSFVKARELNELSGICRKHNIAIICDEVFLDYTIETDRNRVFSLAGIDYVLTFTLSGLSKICGLPQMKLSWIIVSGPRKECKEAMARLEIITDTYLSVGTPIQLALSNLLTGKDLIQSQIKKRILGNYNFLMEILTGNKQLKLLKAGGGWYSVLKINLEIDEESFVYGLLKNKDVYIHPGYFFDFKEEGIIILSLLTEEKVFCEGVKRILTYLESEK